MPKKIMMRSCRNIFAKKKIHRLAGRLLFFCSKYCLIITSRIIHHSILRGTIKSLSCFEMKSNKNNELLTVSNFKSSPTR